MTGFGRRDVDGLADIRTVEVQRVEAVLAVDHVAAVAGIPDEAVVAGAELRRVVAATAGDGIVAVTADQQVVAVTAGDGVVASAAVERELDEAREPIAGRDDIVAAVGTDNEVLGGADIEVEGCRAQPVETYARAIGGDGEGLGPVAAVDLGGVGAVAALEDVVALAGIPDHAVVAGFTEDLIVARAAGQRIVAGAAEEQIVAALAEQRIVAVLAEQQVAARAAGQYVIAVAAEQLRRRERTIGFVERDGVIAGQTEHLDLGGIGDCRLAASDRHGAAIDQKGTGSVAGDRGRVFVIVAEDRQGLCGRREGGLDSHGEVLSRGLGGRQTRTIQETGSAALVARGRGSRRGPHERLGGGVYFTVIFWLSVSRFSQDGKIEPSHPGCRQPLIV